MGCGVEAGGLFAFLCSRTGGFLGIGTIGDELFFRDHENPLFLENPKSTAREKNCWA